MPEPETMTRAAVLAELADIAQTWPQSYRLGDRIAAIAAAVAGWQLNDGLASRDEARRADKSTRAKDVIQ